VSECIFCSIAAGETPADLVWQGENTVFFRDINAKARVHVLGIPKSHATNFAEAPADVITELMRDTQTVAAELGVDQGGYRLVINNGVNAGQEVAHLHVHILGGEPVGPMKC